MKNVDELVRKQRKTPKGEQPKPITYPQVALVAINPHTGQLLALVGGRNYGVSQLNHSTSNRPTGSIFKPFVYATAYNTSLNGTSLDEDGDFTAYRSGFPGLPPTAAQTAPATSKATSAAGHGCHASPTNLTTRRPARQMVGFDNVALGRAAGIASARPPAVSTVRRATDMRGGAPPSPHRSLSMDGRFRPEY
jgi:penicillin-binding protein 1B